MCCIYDSREKDIHKDNDKKRSDYLIILKDCKFKNTKIDIGKSEIF